jgi:hypothetical protein
VLRGHRARQALVAALGPGDRLVLLGDVLELRQGPLREATAAAEPTLRALGGALGEEGEVVIVPGNHDHRLLTGWWERRSLGPPPPPLGLETAVGWEAQEPLGRLAGWLAPARVRAAYPGVWLAPEVYAIHGHYGDLHTTVPMFERLGAGVMARLIGERGREPEAAEDYEAVLAPIYGWLHAVAERRGPATPGESAHAPSARAWRALSGGGRRRRALRVLTGAGVGLIGRAGLGPLRGDLSVPELRRAGLAACGQVVRRLGVGATHVVFGHTHRAGPLPADEQSEWRAGRARLLNTGCWVHEPSFLGRSPRTSPYRAGFAVLLEADGRPPELVNLLD